MDHYPISHVDVIFKGNGKLCTMQGQHDAIPAGHFMLSPTYNDAGLAVGFEKYKVSRMGGRLVFEYDGMEELLVADGTQGEGSPEKEPIESQSSPAMSPEIEPGPGADDGYAEPGEPPASGAPLGQEEEGSISEGPVPVPAPGNPEEGEPKVSGQPAVTPGPPAAGSARPPRTTRIGNLAKKK